MKLIQYSKKYNIKSIKKNFYKKNRSNLLNAIRINKIHKKQGLRKKCKNCKKKISRKIFSQFFISYTICNNCNHLNSIYDDTPKFAKWLYEDNKGKNYDLSYKHEFKNRVKKIYLPKVDFLKKVINKKIKVIDIGSGAGHLLKAFELRNIKAVGFEPNKSLVNYARKKIRKNKIINLSLNETKTKIINETDCNVLSAIGVLTHLVEPESILSAFVKSKIKYLYIFVPLFSLSSFIENSFKQVFPRHLSGGHTHLYTKESLKFMAKKYRLKIIGEWWFGQDIADLHRSLINSSSINDLKKYEKLLDKYLFERLDQLQNILDKNKICSHVHMVLKKK